MHVVLTSYYRFEFLPLIVAFVSETARCLGATAKETAELGMAADEAGTHIIEHYPGDGLQEQFEVRCEVMGDGVRVVFSNMGLPVDAQGLPRYEAARAEETIDGLGLFLLEKLVDRCEFVNEGRAGWRTVLEKRLAGLKVPASVTVTAAPAAETARERLRVVPATAAHVAGIVELAYHTYGYSYCKELFYFADRLRDMLASGRVVSHVALDAADRVVGHMATMYPAHTREIAEIGALMIQPAYRRSTGLLQLIKTVHRGLREQPGELRIVETNLVTTHVLSQRVCGMFDFKPMALKLSVHGRAKFVKLAEEADGQRESLLHAIITLSPAGPLPLFVPPAHAAITARLFANAGINLVPPASAPPVPAHTELTCADDPEAATATLLVQVPGADLIDVLHARLLALESEERKAVFVRIPGWLPATPGVDEAARRLRIFFCGWIEESPERWWALYTRLNAQRFVFDRIQLCDPLAMELRAYVADGHGKAVG